MSVQSQMVDFTTTGTKIIAIVTTKKWKVFHCYYYFVVLSNKTVTALIFLNNLFQLGCLILTSKFKFYLNQFGSYTMLTSCSCSKHICGCLMYVVELRDAAARWRGA